MLRAGHRLQPLRARLVPTPACCGAALLAAAAPGGSAQVCKAYMPFQLTLTHATPLLPRPPHPFAADQLHAPGGRRVWQPLPGWQLSGPPAPAGHHCSLRPRQPAQPSGWAAVAGRDAGRQGGRSNSFPGLMRWCHARLTQRPLPGSLRPAAQSRLTVCPSDFRPLPAGNDCNECVAGSYNLEGGVCQPCPKGEGRPPRCGRLLSCWWGSCRQRLSTCGGTAWRPEADESPPKNKKERNATVPVPAALPPLPGQAPSAAAATTWLPRKTSGAPPPSLWISTPAR